MNETIKNIIADELGIDAATIANDANIVDDLGADSLAVMQIVMAIEDEFGITVAEDQITELKTVNDIASYIEANK
jgi:acyl carrier protein